MVGGVEGLAVVGGSWSMVMSGKGSLAGEWSRVTVGRRLRGAAGGSTVGFCDVFLAEVRRLCGFHFCGGPRGRFVGVEAVEERTVAGVVAGDL